MSQGLTGHEKLEFAFIFGSWNDFCSLSKYILIEYKALQTAPNFSPLHTYALKVQQQQLN